MGSQKGLRCQMSVVARCFQPSERMARDGRRGAPARPFSASGEIIGRSSCSPGTASHGTKKSRYDELSAPEPQSRKEIVVKGILEKAWGYQGDNMNLPVRDLAAALPFYET